MEQEKLTYDEIYQFLIRKINKDKEFIEKFPFFEITACENFRFWEEYVFKGEAKHKQLDDAFSLFKEFIGLETDLSGFEYCEFESISLSKYLPFDKLHKNTFNLKSFSYNNITEEQSKMLWVYDMIKRGLKSTIDHISASYNTNYKPFEFKSNNANEDINGKYILTYKELIKDYFFNEFTDSPDAQTITIIDELKEKVEKMVKKDFKKIEATDKNIGTLLQNADKAVCYIIDEISFYEEWLNKEMPNIYKTLIICEWEDRVDYSIFLEKLLYITLCREKYDEIKHPLEKYKERGIQRTKKESQRKEIPLQMITNWIDDCFSDHISKEDFRYLTQSIEELFEKKDMPKVVEIRNTNILESQDILCFTWVIWFLYKTKVKCSLNQYLICKYIKKQFPVALDGVEETTIYKKMKKAKGNTIKIPEEYKIKTTSRK